MNITYQDFGDLIYSLHVATGQVEVENPTDPDYQARMERLRELCARLEAVYSPTKRDCYKCMYRGNIPGDHHSCCHNHKAHVVGDPHGIAKGWFFWPINFDPIWLLSCDGFKEQE